MKIIQGVGIEQKRRENQESLVTLPHYKFWINAVSDYWRVYGVRTVRRVLQCRQETTGYSGNDLAAFC